MSQQCSTAIARMGIDIGKSVFHVVGLDAKGKPVFRNRFTRERLLEFLARASPTIIGMEACPGSNWLARKAMGQGHQVRIVPAQFVKPFVKSNKTDIVDAEAIAEAISRPTMRFTQPKTEAQLDLQALHRVRQRLVSSKTAIVNQARAFLLEYGLMSTYGGKVYSLPLGYDAYGLFYRKDLFDKAGIHGEPADWAQFLDACRKLKAAGIAPIAVAARDAWTLAAWFDYLDLPPGKASRAFLELPLKVRKPMILRGFVGNGMLATSGCVPHNFLTKHG